jgi:hypothetical protein
VVLTRLVAAVLVALRPNAVLSIFVPQFSMPLMLVPQKDVVIEGVKLKR